MYRTTNIVNTLLRSPLTHDGKRTHMRVHRNGWRAVTSIPEARAKSWLKKLGLEKLCESLLSSSYPSPLKTSLEASDRILSLAYALEGFRFKFIEWLNRRGGVLLCA